MTEYEYLGQADADTVAHIIALSTETLLANPDVSDDCTRFEEGRRALDQDKLGISGLCMESSDAVTRAAHALGVVAAREPLVGWHFITYFGPLNRMPSEDDLILCRTWGQYDNDLYTSNHPLARKPFFGPRKELAALLPGSQGRFEPESVMYRQLVHAPGRSPARRRPWLATEPQELVRTNFVMGQSKLPAPAADSHWL